jgi:hypothetical protein
VLLLHHGLLGWLVLALPAVSSAAPALAAATATTCELRAALVFRAQWRWRVPATHRLAAAFARGAAFPEETAANWGTAGHAQLGSIAGRLERIQASQTVPGSLAAPGYGLVCVGTVTAVTQHGEHVPLTVGDTWGPSSRLTGCRRAVLVHISAAALQEILATAFITSAAREVL